MVRFSIRISATAVTSFFSVGAGQTCSAPIVTLFTQIKAQHMPYQSISSQRHYYLQRDYLGNRSEFVAPIKSYQEDVEQWALTAKNRMHEHCQSLLKAAANPRLLAEAINQIGRRDCEFSPSNVVSLGTTA